MQLDIFSVTILSIVGIAFLYALFVFLRVKLKGIEVDATVSRIEEEESLDSDGTPSVSYNYFVSYRTQEGQQFEATLGNPKSRLSVGSRIRIKYLPGRENYAVLTKIL